MRELVLFILAQLVDNTEAVDVVETADDYGRVILTLHIAKEDMGRVIGKQGRIIRSIRDVVKILALKQNKLVDVVLAE